MDPDMDRVMTGVRQSCDTEIVQSPTRSDNKNLGNFNIQEMMKEES